MGDVRASEDAATILRASGNPIWRSIACVLSAEIEAGEPAAGTRLPSEAALAARFGVNRHTLRRAIDALAREGVLEVQQGRGTFVAEDVLDYAVGARTRFSEWIRRHNKEPSGRVIQLQVIGADRGVAAGLGIGADAPVVLFERLGMADGRPVCLSSHWFPLGRFPALPALLRRHGTITAALREAGIADYRRQVTRVSARLPSAEEAALLATSRNRPVLVTENVNVDGSGEIVEFGVGRYPTPRVQIVFEP